MTVTLKRKRVPVSYKEPSSDDDISESFSDERTSEKRIIPSRRSARRTQPVDPVSSGNEHASPEPVPVQHQRASRNTRRRGKRAISYKDISSDEYDEDPDADFEMEPEQMMAVRTRTRPNAPSSSESQAKRGQKHRSRRNRAVGAPLAPNNEAHVERQELGIPTDGNIPVRLCLLLQDRLQNTVAALRIDTVLILCCLGMDFPTIPRTPPDLRLRITSTPR